MITKNKQNKKDEWADKVISERANKRHEQFISPRGVSKDIKFFMEMEI